MTIPGVIGVLYHVVCAVYTRCQPQYERCDHSKPINVIPLVCGCMQIFSFAICATAYMFKPFCIYIAYYRSHCINIYRSIIYTVPKLIKLCTHAINIILNIQ